MADPKFLALTVKFSQKVAQIITDLAISSPYDPKSPPDPLPQQETTKALWDTGASKSVISRDLVKKLGLVATGATNVNHAGGASVSPTHVVNFQLPNRVVVAGVLVTEFEGFGNFGAIIGMDVITLGDLAITNVSGQTWMSFRTPSMVGIDYVAEHTKERIPRVGRNDPCPCGSRKKFKKCHGA